MRGSKGISSTSVQLILLIISVMWSLRFRQPAIPIGTTGQLQDGEIPSSKGGDFEWVGGFFQYLSSLISPSFFSYPLRHTPDRSRNHLPITSWAQIPYGARSLGLEVPTYSTNSIISRWSHKAPHRALNCCNIAATVAPNPPWQHFGK
jgi:hypothetical protein